MPEKVHDWHLQEEGCLFFVALSRARDTLWLSRAKRYGKQGSNPSDFLTHIQSCLPRMADTDPTLPTRTGEESEDEVDISETRTLTATSRDLETYMRCPKQYLFDAVLGLGGRRTNTAYVRFHACVYRTLNWIHVEEAKGVDLKDEAVLQVLDVAWKEGGPRDDVYEKFYRKEAERFLKEAVRRLGKSPGRALDLEWEIPLNNGTVLVKPDRLILIQTSKGEQITVQRWRTGKPSKKAPDDEVYALYTRGGKSAFPNASVEVEVLYLSTGETRAATLSDKAINKSLDAYNDALVGILQGKFNAIPSDWYCPRCPHYFICPAPEFRHTVE